MTTPQYNWQCLHGHVGEITPGSPLEVKAKTREAAGYLDAICLPYTECPYCKEEARRRDEGYTLSDLDW